MAIGVYIYIQNPASYVKTVPIGKEDKSLVQTGVVNHRFLGSRETLKTNLLSKGVVDDLWYIENKVVGQLSKLRTDSTTYFNSLNSIIRQIQHLRAQWHARLFQL